MSSADDTQEDYQLNEDIIFLNNIWRSECNAPEILPYCEEVVERVKDSLTNQQVT